MSELSDEPRAQLGCQVEMELIFRSGNRERLKFDLVPDEQADYVSGFLGASTHLAQALLGERIGVTIPYFTEELMAVEIIAIQESTRVPKINSASRREAALKDAQDQIEFTNAILFAASVDTKWGEYDADGLDFEEWKAKRSKGDNETESRQI